jgi:toxin ParE1/3/4
MRVRRTDPAQTDFLPILGYIARDNPAAAERPLLSAIDALAAQPRLGRPGRLAGTRELVMPRLPYVAVYRIVEAAHSSAREVEVLRVHRGDQWPSNGG